MAWKQQKHLITSVFIKIICMLKSLYQIVWETFVNLPDFFILQDSIIKKLLLAFHVAIAFAFTLTLLLLVTQYWWNSWTLDEQWTLHWSNKTVKTFWEILTTGRPKLNCRSISGCSENLQVCDSEANQHKMPC